MPDTLVLVKWHEEENHVPGSLMDELNLSVVVRPELLQYFIPQANPFPLPLSYLNGKLVQGSSLGLDYGGHQGTVQPPEQKEAVI